MGITQIIPDGLTHPHHHHHHHNHNHNHHNNNNNSNTFGSHSQTNAANSSPVSTRSYTDSANTKSSFDFSAMQAQLPPNTGPPGTVPVTNGSSSTNNKNLGHVPCKFYRQGICQAGNTCPFSHNLDGALGADKVPCKYFQKGNCKFGLKCALAHFLPDGTRVNSKNFLLPGSNHGHGNNNGKQNTRRSSFNTNYGGAAHSAANTTTTTTTNAPKNTGASGTGATPPEYENSFISSDYASSSAVPPTNRSPANVVPNGGGLSNHNVATFINIGYQQQQQHQQQQPQPQAHPQSQPQSQPQQQHAPQSIHSQPSQQEPISLSLITQESLARSSSFSRSEFNYQFPPQSSSFQTKSNSYNNGFHNTSSSFQNQPSTYTTSTAINNNNHYHQRLLLMQNLLFGSNSYSGAFATTNTSYNAPGSSTQTSPFARSNSINLSVNTASVEESPPAQYFSATSTLQTTPPGYVSSATTPTSRFSFGSRVPSQSYQTHPQHSKLFGSYIPDHNTNTSAIADDDEFPLTKTGVMFDNVFFMDNE
ncbi:hypothetical protein Cantr_00290 [Candida viswanathii]|uniref:C3H1-type domain-containing protein n=1 Tax=Candida viswanathii TaxID=5486 RepID=A0A367YG06_9ASCO|nr:hypothetical protein Cantr_00290 [Candida viswanathii]